MFILTHRASRRMRVCVCVGDLRLLLHLHLSSYSIRCETAFDTHQTGTSAVPSPLSTQHVYKLRFGRVQTDRFERKNQRFKSHGEHFKAFALYFVSYSLTKPHTSSIQCVKIIAQVSQKKQLFQSYTGISMCATLRYETI